MPKREKQLTRRERQALFGKGPSGTPQKNAQHIHCIACGRHIDPRELKTSPPGALYISCAHGSRFATCSGCQSASQARLDEHDRSGQPPRIAQAWH